MSLTPQTVIRALEQRDTPHLMRLMMQWWRVYWRITPHETDRKFQQACGVIAEDSVGLKGFMLIERRPAGVSAVIAAGLRDSWSVPPFVSQMLPKVEELICGQATQSLMCLGSADWLTTALLQHGFQPHDWLMGYEWGGEYPSPIVPQVATIRRVKPDDISGLIQLDRAAFKPRWQIRTADFETVLQKPHVVYIAEFNRQIAGYLWGEQYQQHLHVNRLAVHPTYQGRRIGAGLLRQAMSWAIAENVNKFSVNTLEHNHCSRKLYKRLGFVETKQRIPVLWKSC